MDNEAVNALPEEDADVFRTLRQAMVAAGRTLYRSGLGGGTWIKNLPEQLKEYLHAVPGTPFVNVKRALPLVGRRI